MPYYKHNSNKKPSARSGSFVNRSRRGFLGGVGVLGLAGLLGACGDITSTPAPIAAALNQSSLTKGKRLKAAFCSGGVGADPQVSWSAQGKLTAETWAKWFGVELTWYNPDSVLEKQVAAIEEIASKQYDFVAIQPLAPDVLVPSVQKLIDKGVPVIQMDTHLDSKNKLNITASIEPDNSYMSSVVVDYLFQKIGGKGKVIMTQGSLSHTGAQARAKGFKETLAKYPNIELVADDAAEWQADKVSSLWKTYLAKHKDIAGAFFHNDEMALAAASVIKEAGREGILLAGVDAMPGAIKAVTEGTLLTTVRNPAGRIHWGALMLGILAATGTKDIPKYILADGPIVTKENAAGLLFMENQLLL